MYALKNILLLYFFLDSELLDQIINIHDYLKRPYTANITLRELKEYTQATEGNQAIKEINDAVKLFSLDDNEKINLLQYLNLTEKLDDHKIMKDAFQTFDKDNDGFIAANDLLELMHSIGDTYITIEDASEMIKNATEGNSDIISFKQFQDYMGFK